MDFATRSFLEQSIEKLDLEVVGNICEIGSLQVNGEVRSMFESPKSYLGVDIDEGPGVDLVGHFCDVDLGDKKFDLILSLNCLEHDVRWRQTLEKSLNYVSDGGYLVIFVPTEIAVSEMFEMPFLQSPTHLRCLEDYKVNTTLKQRQASENISYPCHWPDQKNKRLKPYYSDDSHVTIWPPPDFVVPFSSFLTPSTHIAMSKKFVISHNVHYTEDEEYYSSLSMGKILGSIYSTNDFANYRVVHREISVESGMQLGLVIKKEIACGNDRL
tara:strand:- start:633 stop:1442 length:810 start_codon:yes stop_codon:yes gene_type:complete